MKGMHPGAGVLSAVSSDHSGFAVSGKVAGNPCAAREAVKDVVSCNRVMESEVVRRTGRLLL